MKKIIFILFAALSVAGLLLASTPAERMSRYLTLKGMQATIERDPASAYELYKKALAANPDNLEAGYSYGVSIISMADDTAKLHEGLDYMLRYVESYPADITEVQNYAYICREAGKTDEALRVLARLAELNPDNSEILPLMGETATAGGDMKAAREYYTRYEAKEGVSPELSLRKMSLWLYEKDTVNALAETDRLIASNPSIPDFYLLKGNLYSYLDKQDSALVMYRKAESIDPKNGGVKLALAGWYQQAKDSLKYDEAVYEALLSEDIDLEVKLEMLAEYVTPLLEAKASTAHADYLLGTLREQYPHEAEIQDFSARYSAAKSDWKNAIEQIQVAIDMEPDNNAYKTQKLSYLVADKRYDDAIREYEAVRDTSMNTRLELFFYGAAAYTGAGLDEKAKTDAIALLGKILPNVAPGDTLKAADLAALNANGTRMVANIYSIIGDIDYRAKDMAGMRLAYNNALTANPDDPMTLNNYAYYLCESGGDLEKALQMSKTAITQAPDNATFLDTYAWILFKRREYKEALTYQRSALEKAEGDDLSYDLYDHLGDILFMNGLPKEALEQWQKALKLEPDNELLKKKVKYKTYFYE